MRWLRLDVSSWLCRLSCMSTEKAPLGAFAHWPRQPCDRALLREMNDAAISAVDRWEVAKGLPAEISDILGADAKLGYAVPGLRVTIPGDPGRSRCDVFALVEIENRHGGIGIFATDDGFDETVRDWQKGGVVAEGKGRLGTVCRLLEVQPQQTEELRYKLLHRMAAAILKADDRRTKFVGLIVQSFSHEKKGLEDFKAFCALLGAEDEVEPGKPCWVMRPSGRRILLGWADSPCS